MDIDKATTGILTDEAISLGVECMERHVPLEELTKILRPYRLAIVLLDWSIICSEESKGYMGHFVPVVGYSETHVFIHNQTPRADGKNNVSSAHNYHINNTIAATISIRQYNIEVTTPKRLPCPHS